MLPAHNIFWPFTYLLKQIFFKSLNKSVLRCHSHKAPSGCSKVAPGHNKPLNRPHPTPIHSSCLQPSFYRTAGFFQTWIMLTMVEKEHSLQNTTCYGRQLSTSSKWQFALPPSASSPIRHFLKPSQPGHNVFSLHWFSQNDETSYFFFLPFFLNSTRNNR